ncbi:hypothetical protein LJR232_002412 [Aquipseudomonas alcaligenes]
MKYLLTLLLAITLAGCQINQNSQFQPQDIPAAGPYRHDDTGIVFPTTAGIFLRTQIVRFDEQARHIMVGYNSELIAQPVVFTAYVYPVPQVSSIGSPADVIAAARHQLVLNHQQQQKQEILAFHKTGTLVGEQPATLDYRGQAITGLRADFEFVEPFAGEVQPIRSSLYLFELGDSLLKFRVSAPASVDSEAAVKAMIEGIAGTAGR